MGSFFYSHSPGEKKCKPAKVTRGIVAFFGSAALSFISQPRVKVAPCKKQQTKATPVAVKAEGRRLRGQRFLVKRTEGELSRVNVGGTRVLRVTLVDRLQSELCGEKKKEDGGRRGFLRLTPPFHARNIDLLLNSLSYSCSFARNPKSKVVSSGAAALILFSPSQECVSEAYGNVLKVYVKKCGATFSHTVG